MDNVTPIGPRQKEKAKASNKDQLTAAEKCHIFAEWLDGRASGIMGAEPPKKFCVIEKEDQHRQIYEVTDNKELIARDVSAVVVAISDAVRGNFVDDDLWRITPNTITQAATHWHNSSKAIAKPPRLGWLGEDGLVMRRIPFERSEGPTPLWDELLSRITNAEALKAWIGSLLVEDSDVQQYVWLHGQGGEGKGALARFLGKVLGHTYSAQQPPSPTDRFWTWGIREARLVVFPDCNNTSFVTSGLFKSLTGDDLVRIEVKGGRIMNQRIRAKYLFLSNEKPDLSSEVADRRRIIYCQAQGFEGESDATYERRLWAEGGHFLTACLAAYHAQCPDHGQIRADASQINDVISANEEDYQAFLDANFIVSPAHWCEPVALQELLAPKYKTKAAQTAFRAFLERRGIIRKSSNIGNCSYYRYVYIGMKPRVASTVTSLGIEHYASD